MKLLKLIYCKFYQWAGKYGSADTPQAEIYQAGVIDCAVGDSISIDTDKRQFTIKKSSGEQLINYIILSDNESFFEYARKNFQKL